MTQVIQTLEQQQYLAKLLDYDYIIQYRFSFGNVAADALSWIVPQGQCLILSIPNLDCLEDIKLFNLQSLVYRDLLHKIRQQLESHSDYSVHSLAFGRIQLYPTGKPYGYS